MGVGCKDRSVKIKAVGGLAVNFGLSRGILFNASLRFCAMAYVA